MGKVKNWIVNRFPRAMHNKQAFVLRLPRNCRILDVGCGNNSPKLIKQWRMDINYTGIDVSDYNNTKQSLSYADKYVLSSPHSFPEDIANLNGNFDAVISCHNIEHCNKPDETLDIICKSLKTGGKLYMAFPCEESINFPHREGTLNFYDDETHIEVPKFQKIIDQLKENGMEIRFAKKHYRPLYYYMLGGFLEPMSKKRKKVMRGTWAFWGFETVIWAEKI